jgi:hypothetical protein
LLGPGRFFSFLIIYTQSVGLLGQGISPSQDLYLYTEQHKHRINAHNTDIHVLSRIRTNDPRVRVNEDSLCLRPRSHCDRQKSINILKNISIEPYCLFHIFTLNFPKSILILLSYLYLCFQRGLFLCCFLIKILYFSYLFQYYYMAHLAPTYVTVLTAIYLKSKDEPHSKKSFLQLAQRIKMSKPGTFSLYMLSCFQL